MKSRLVGLARGWLRRFGLELLHYTGDPVLRDLTEVRETLRVSPNSPPWVWDHLLSQLAAKAHLRNLMRANDIDLVLDVGANRGQFGRLLREVGYTRRIVSFEPTQAAFEILGPVARADPCWEALRLALGEADAEASMNVYRSDDFSSLHAASAAGRERFSEYLDLDHVESVAVRRLDDIMQTVPEGQDSARILLKTDTQGHDLAVLRGAAATLARTRVVVTEATVRPIYEGIPTYRDIIDFLGSNGFEPSGLYPLSHERDFALIELDCFFVRRAKDAR